MDLVQESTLMEEYSKKSHEQAVKIKDHLNEKYDIDLEAHDVEFSVGVVEGYIKDIKGRDVLHVRGIGEAKWMENGFFRWYRQMGEDYGHEVFFFPLGDSKYFMVARDQ